MGRRLAIVAEVFSHLIIHEYNLESGYRLVHLFFGVAGN